MPEEKLINRPEYLEKLIKWSADTTLIKIITGVRRCIQITPVGQWYIRIPDT